MSSYTGNMATFKILSIATTLCLFGNAQAQFETDTADLLPVSSLPNTQSFVYRLITQEYLNNENGYFLDVSVDTQYLHFKRIEGERSFSMQRSKSDNRIVSLRRDTLMAIPLQLKFTQAGEVQELLNWKSFRDVFMANYSIQVRLGQKTSEEFEEAKNTLNNEGYVRRLVMEDISYLFGLHGDTFKADAEYIRLKTIRSPFSGNDYYFQGYLKFEKPLGTKNTVIFRAKNAAGEKEKPLLMEEAKAYLRKTVPAGEPVSEIHSVGLNSEQYYQYNAAQKRMIQVTLSDVVALDMSSRGNIRTFDLWDLTE